jgi:hypothetical protein
VDAAVTAAAPGPLAEEAARLVEALGEWARGAMTDGAAGAGHAPECQLCPFCQLLAVARRTQPETFNHLADASASVVAALRTVLEAREHGNGRHRGVERIDLDGGVPR